MGAPVGIHELQRYANSPSQPRQLRADLQAWAVEAIERNHVFRSTFLFGLSPPPPIPTYPLITNRMPPQQRNTSGGDSRHHIPRPPPPPPPTPSFPAGSTVHPSTTTTTRSTSEIAIAIPQTTEGLPITSETAPPVSYIDASAYYRRAGAKVEITYVTTVGPTGISTVTTTARTCNPFLSKLAGLPNALVAVAELVGVLVGEELARARAVGDLIAAVDWAAHDAP